MRRASAPSRRPFSTHRRTLALLAGAATAIMASPGAAQTAPVLPSGGRIAGGDVVIGPTTGGTLTISQASSTGIINWADFSIGTGGTVRFENGTGATLNRVDGASASRIDGSLLASGSVYLINPRGVIVGKGGVVDVGGSFVASTLDIADADFVAGGDKTLSGASGASVVNLGRIGALGGDVALVATHVSNAGSISAPGGTVALTAGSSVLIRDTALDGGRFVVLVGGRDTAVTNSGTITATIAELRAAGGSIYALAGNISGVISADQVTGNNGSVFLTAGDGGSVSVGSTIRSGTPYYGGTVEISGENVDVGAGALIDVSAASVGGQVYLRANQKLAVAGTIAARGSDQGGLLWTFARNVDAADATVDTRGAVVGNWLLAQPTLSVDARLAGSIGRHLRTTNLELLANPPDFGEDPADGNLTIDAPITLTGPNQLTLLAANTIRVNQNVTVPGSGVLNLEIYGADPLGAPISFAPNRSISFTGPAGGGQALNLNGDSYALIYSVADLKAMAADPAGHYAIARSFAAGGTPLAGPAVGTETTPFSGIFEGLGHSINGLRIDAPGQLNVGLFGVAAGTIRNVSLVGGSVVGGTTVGALVGNLSQGNVIYATSSASVSRRGSGDGSTGSSIGGLVGFSYLGQVSGSSASGLVDAVGSGGVGGLVGGGYGLGVTDSFATGEVRGGDSTGGLVGAMARSGIANSFATGAVTGRQSVGGLVGDMTYAYVDASRASGRVSGRDRVGGLIGDMSDSGAGDSSASGNVTASIGLGGGLVGSMMYSDLTRSSASGRVSGGTSVGGLVGTMNLSILTDTTASGAVTASGSFAGGLVGQAMDSSVLGSVATGSVRGTRSVGGLVGSARSSDPRFPRYSDYADDRATGTVVGTADVGGLIGTAVNISIDRVVARGAVNGTLGIGENVGGLVGRSEATDITAAVAMNAVRGRVNVGGLIGRRTGGALNDVSASGPVSGTRNVGPLIGLDDPAP